MNTRYSRLLLSAMLAFAFIVQPIAFARAQGIGFGVKPEDPLKGYTLVVSSSHTWLVALPPPSSVVSRMRP